MKQRKRFLCVLLLAAGCCFSACTSKSNPFANLQGTWKAPEFGVIICNPSDICAEAGFSQGSTLSAILVLNQTNGSLNGTYSYEGTPISVPVSGSTGASVFSLSGVTAIPSGNLSVDVGGSASGNQMTATVTHQMTLKDGTVANITGSGTFTR